MLLLWLITFALAASPQLHQWLHDDALNLGHQCLITQIHQHPLLVGLAVVLVPVPPVAGVGLSGATALPFLSARKYRLSPSRAPPLVFPTTTVAG